MNRLLALAALSILLVGCTNDQITQTLEAAVDAAIAADSVARPQDAPYLAIAQQCLDTATNVLASAAPPASQALSITAACAGATTVEAGSPVAMQAVAAALNRFLDSVGQVKAALEMPRFSSSFAPAAPARHVDQNKLARIRRKLDRLKHPK